MGMDFVELILEVENSFDFRMSNEDAARIRTVGDLHRQVLLSLNREQPIQCRTSRAFYRLRRAVSGEFGVTRDRFQLGASVLEWQPPDDHRVLWSRLSASLGGLALPDLVLSPEGYHLLCLCFAALFTSSTACAFICAPSAGAGFRLWLLMSGLGAVGLLALRRFFPTEIPADCRTVSGLARRLAARNHVALGTSDGGSDHCEVWDALCDIISRQLAVRREDIYSDSTFVEDFGVD